MPATADLRLHLQRDGAQRRRRARSSLRGRQRARAAGRDSPYLLVDEAVEDADQQSLPDEAPGYIGGGGRIINTPSKALTLARLQITPAAAALVLDFCS